VLIAPRRWALLAVIASLMYLSQRGGVDVFGLRMYPFRFVEIAGFIRVVSKHEFKWRELNRLDRIVLAAYAYVTIVFVLRSALGFGTSVNITMTTPLSKIGEFVDMLLAYTMFRGLMRNEQDIRWLLQRSVMLLIPFVAVVAIERWTGQNPLAILGAAPTVWIDAEEGRIRCFGSFSHPALLGTFGASFALMYVGLALASTRQVLGWVGVVLCVALVVLAASGGPLTMLMVGLLAWLCWPMRTRMKMVRIGIVMALLVLAVVMRDPIWYLPSKMSLLFGGSGWHRSYLMDRAIRNIDHWWLAGMPLEQTSSWFPYLVHGAADLTNVYVAIGVDGGLIAMLLLIRVLVRAFGDVGRASKEFREALPPRKDEQLLTWGLGAAVAGHMANFLSITYFDQTNSLWLFQLAAISAISAMQDRLANDYGRTSSESMHWVPYTAPIGRRAGRTGYSWRSSNR
jgi:hypothetical protein